MRWVTFLSASSSKLKPSSWRFFWMFALPEVFPKAYLRLRPKRSGSKSLKYKLFLLSPSACIPAVCVNTLAPTIGLFAGILKPVKVATKRLTLCKEVSLILTSIPGIKSFTTATKLASGVFPARSPIPFTVKCKPWIPALIASIALATLKS